MLLVGLGGLGAEVAKNLILAGVKGLTMLDHEKVYYTQMVTYTMCCFTIERHLKMYFMRSNRVAHHHLSLNYIIDMDILT